MRNKMFQDYIKIQITTCDCRIITYDCRNKSCDYRVRTYNLLSVARENVFFPSLQSDAFYLHNVLAEEDRSGFLELGGAFGGEETASPVLGATAVHFRMPS